MASLIPWKKRHSLSAPLRDRPWYPLDEFRREMESLMDRFWQPWNEGTWPWQDRRWGFDVRDEQNDLIVEADAPGFEAEDFQVEVRGDQLLIQATHREEASDKQGSSCRVGSFERSVRLPAGVEIDKIEATYHNGVLELRIPKGEAARQQRIRVKGT